MKTVAVVLLVCFAAAFAKISEDQKEMLRPYKEACIAETGVDKKILNDAEKSTTADSEVDDKVACFSACMFKKIGFMNSQGKLDEDIIRAFMSANVPEETLNNAINNCKNEVGKNDCETAGKMIKCFIKNKAAMVG